MSLLIQTLKHKIFNAIVYWKCFVREYGGQICLVELLCSRHPVMVFKKYKIFLCFWKSRDSCINLLKYWLINANLGLVSRALYIETLNFEKEVCLDLIKTDLQRKKIVISQIMH